MKLITDCCFSFLLLSVLIPKETEAFDRKLLFAVAKLALQQGYKLGKLFFYAKCMIENVPPGIKCAPFVLGLGLSADAALETAQFIPKAQCKPYLGRCSTYQFVKLPGM